MGSPFACVVNLGCRVNRVESDRISAGLVHRGFSLVEEDDADLIVINTCAVTGEAEAKTRKAVRHALSRARRPFVLVTGCVVNLHPGELTDLSDRVIAEPSKIDVPARAADLMGMAPHGPSDSPSSGDLHGLADLLGRSRWGVKIQDGCNNRCSYCIVWKARGPERSVPVSSVVDQVQAAVEAGIFEVVLTGINLAAYDAEGARDSHVELDELLQLLLERTDIPQIRLSSMEPMDVTDRLIEVVAASNGRIAPFFHLPLQSGSSSVLARMARPYTAEEYRGVVGRIRRRIPEAAISCDVIAGFPGETDGEHRESVEFCRSIRFSRMHVFRYSARPGTVAAEAPDQVDPRVASSRAAELRGVALDSARAEAASRVGSRESIVLEYGNRGTLSSFHRAIVDDLPLTAKPALLTVRLDRIDEHGILHALAGVGDGA